MTKQLIKEISISLCEFLIFASLVGVLFAICAKTPPPTTPSPAPIHTNLFALLVTTNLVSQPCSCGFCDSSKGIRVPEHLNQIGYDLKLVVSTNYLPIVSHPIP